MTVDELCERVSGRRKAAGGSAHFFFTVPSALRHVVMYEHEFEKIKDWPHVYVMSSRRNYPNECRLYDDDLETVLGKTKIQLNKIYKGREGDRW